MINFLPWVGKNYVRGIRGKRVLVLGESHYCARLEDANAEITRYVIGDLIDPNSEFEPYKNTYTKFAKALSGNGLDGSPLSVAQKAELWHSVIFYNYVQAAMTGPRTAPTAKEFRDSEAAFWEVLELFKPERIIVWGHRLYDALPGKGHQLPDIRIDGLGSFERWCYNLKTGQEVHLLKMSHPSSGYTPELWHKVIVEFLK